MHQVRDLMSEVKKTDKLDNKFENIIFIDN